MKLVVRVHPDVCMSKQYIPAAILCRVNPLSTRMFQVSLFRRRLKNKMSFSFNESIKIPTLPVDTVTSRLDSPFWCITSIVTLIKRKSSTHDFYEYRRVLVPNEGRPRSDSGGGLTSSVMRWKGIRPIGMSILDVWWVQAGTLKEAVWTYRYFVVRIGGCCMQYHRHCNEPLE